MIMKFHDHDHSLIEDHFMILNQLESFCVTGGDQPVAGHSAAKDGERHRTTGDDIFLLINNIFSRTSVCCYLWGFWSVCVSIVLSFAMPKFSTTFVAYSGKFIVGLWVGVVAESTEELLLITNPLEVEAQAEQGKIVSGQSSLGLNQRNYPR